MTQDERIAARFTAIDIKPPESPGDVRLTFNVPYDIWRATDFNKLRGEFTIARVSAATPSGTTETKE